MIKAIIFDFDGVLFDSQALHFETCNQTLLPLGLEVSLEEYLAKYVGLTDNAIFSEILVQAGQTLSFEKLQMLTYEKIKHYKHALSQYTSLQAVPGVTDFLAVFSKKLDQFGICSNGSATEVHGVLDKLEGGKLKAYFSKVTTRDEVAQGKPSPEGYLKTADHLQVDPKHCLVIEDSIAGIQAGKNAGMTVVGITTSHEPPALKAADFVARTYPDIQTWLLHQL